MSEKKNITDDHYHQHDHAHSHLPSDPELRVKAVETLLLNKGLIDSKTLDELIDTYENRIGPKNGAKVVAKAWVDPEYKKRLLNDATSAIRELSYQGRQGENMVVVENTPETHNVIVVHYVVVIHGQSLAFPQLGIKVMNIDLEQ